MGRLQTARSFWDRLDPKVTFGCFAFSADELAGFVKAQLVLGHVFPAACRFVVLEAIFFLSLEGSVGNVSPVFCFRFRSVFDRFGLGFRWCLAFSHPLPTRSIFVFARLGCATVVVQLLRSCSWL